MEEIVWPYTFTFSYTNDKEAKLTFKHTFKNERVTAKISLQKQDKETKKAVPQGDATLEKAVYGPVSYTHLFQEVLILEEHWQYGQ